MKKSISFLFAFFLILNNQAQNVSGNLTEHIGQEIILKGYNGFETINLSKAIVDHLGNFNLKPEKKYSGIGYLETSDKSTFLFVINEEDIIIEGVHLKNNKSIVVKNSKENSILNQYIFQNNIREKVLYGWKFLLPYYKEVIVVNGDEKYIQFIKQEIARLEQQENNFFENIEESLYVKWYLPIRKYLNNISYAAKYDSQNVSQLILDFREINFNDSSLLNSGLVDDLIESHYWLIENSGESLDNVYEEMNSSTAYLIKCLDSNGPLLNDVTHFLFNYLEKKSLFKASEFLALKMLTQNQCILNDNLTNQLESYRKLKVGNVAPDITFENNTKLSDINANILLVFGASWCPNCKEDALKLLSYYDAWREKDLEIVYIALDTDKEAFNTAYKNAPWQTYCDFKGWDSKSAKDYHISGTPTYFLLDKNTKILVRPASLEQVDAWVNYKL